MWFLRVWIFVWLSLKLTQLPGNAAWPLKALTHGHSLEVKKNKADDVDELWECVRDLSESSFGDAA